MSDKIKYELEFPIQASPSLLYQYISTPSGLSEWFADNVNSRGELFTFIWEGSEEEAKLLSKKADDRIKLRWTADDEEGLNYYFEMKIQVDEITKDVSLMITDFAEEDEVDEGKMLWENTVSDLKQILGSS
ncbi:SRPBCC domain-containing protein [Psychroflexus sp. CAK57W]|uniref:START-like domain-containing protein n=1 Tax=Psychroflexus curvus TaxID=2873595 RepID=UPI001CCA4803|nr:START-like domain-containing protein [Psychroflexus curvus]MBZ9626859.1 SRPBCC domain-containing protein [Psychroflexus curvus]MBZ9786633.1 SRPBCC domain-containing protein [Psychroflexus curvus]